MNKTEIESYFIKTLKLKLIHNQFNYKPLKKTCFYKDTFNFFIVSMSEVMKYNKSYFIYYSISKSSHNTNKDKTPVAARQNGSSNFQLQFWLIKNVS